MKLPEELAETKGVLSAALHAWDDWLERAGAGLDLAEALPTPKELDAQLQEAEDAEPPPPREDTPFSRRVSEMMEKNWPDRPPSGRRRRWWRRR